MKTLLIEQATEDYSVIYQCLRRTNLQIESVGDGPHAVERATREKYDLIILDLVRPVESSLLALHEIRESSRDCEILILASADQVKDRVTALIQGADDYLLKPVDGDEFRARIAILARRHQQALAPGRHAGRDENSRITRRIENLWQLSQRANPPVELVISEASLALLVDSSIDRLRASAAALGIRLEHARCAFPDVLVDACWMEHLLLVLLDYALAQSPANGVVLIGFDDGARSGTALGTLSIDARAAPAGGAGSATRPAPGTECRLPIDSLALAKFCADNLRLKVECGQSDDHHLQIRVSKLRMR